MRRPLLLAIACLVVTPAAVLAQSQEFERETILGFGGGVFSEYVDIDQAHRHLMAYVAYRYAPHWSIAGELGVVFDNDRLFGSGAIVVTGLLREDGVTPFVVFGPTLLGSGSTAFLLVVGGGLQIPLSDSDVSLGVRMHSDGFDFSPVVPEILAQFQFPI